MIAYRAATLADRKFIVSGWSTSFRTSHSAGMIAMERWADIMHREIESVIERPDCTTLVAYEPDETPGLVDLYGFIAGDSDAIWSPVARAHLPMVFYVYVKGPQRERGIARGLFRALGVDPSKPFVHTCKTSWCSLLSSKIPLSKWDPLLARFPRNDNSPPKVETKHGQR